MRSEALAARNALSLARARAAADGAIERTVYELSRPRLPAVWQPNGLVHRWQEDDVTFTVSAVDEASRIDLNAAPDALLRSMLVSVGLERDRAEALADAIADWRDPDDLKRPHGAEADDYRAAGLTYTPTNGPFETVADVGRVLGMTGDIYQRIRPLATVWSRQPGVNPGTASREVLLALPNASAETVDAYLAQRQAALDAGLPLPPFSAAQGNISGAIPVWHIAAQASLPDGVTFAREAVLRPSSDPQRPLITLAWLESPRLVAAASAAAEPADAAAPRPGASSAQSMR
jgi:general secretion pathway protein K